MYYSDSNASPARVEHAWNVLQYIEAFVLAFRQRQGRRGCRILQHRRETLQGSPDTPPRLHMWLMQLQTLPTYDFLSKAGITPSSSKTYTLSTLTSALKSATGVTPALNCDGNNLNAIEWYFNLKGSVIDGTFVPIGMYPDEELLGTRCLYPARCA